MGDTIYFNASTVPIGDHFPIELWFCITIPKAQGWTIHIASLSKHPGTYLKFQYEQIYTLLSHNTGCNDIWSLLQMGSKYTLHYISNLEKDPYTDYYLRGFWNESSNQVAHPEPILTANTAGFKKRYDFVPVPFQHIGICWNWTSEFYMSSEIKSARF